MKKIFITADELLADSFRLAEQIYHSGFRPHFIVGLWRGGAPVGIAVQEYLDYAGVKTDHIAVRTAYYTAPGQHARRVSVHGLGYVLEHISADNALLLVDDVFDSGRSMQAVVKQLEEQARHNLPTSIKLACPWYKPAKNTTPLTPDYYLHETDAWLVFPHEIVGLTPEEISGGKPGIADTLAQLHKTET